jgi:hypothetical protein
MRLLRATLVIGFVAALAAVYYVVYLRAPVTWVEWGLLSAGVSLLGGFVIGRQWAVAVAFAVNVLLSLLLVATVALLTRHVGSGAAFLLVQVLLSTGATAAAIRLRWRFAGRFAGPS